MSKKRKATDLADLHVSELYSMIQKGDRDALNELIERQQSGTSLRFYPEGRKGPFDDGMLPIVVDVNDRSVCIRSGQPHRSVLMDKELALAWLLGIPKCLSHAVRLFKDEGLEQDDIEFELELRATVGFKHKITPAPEEDGAMITFYPLGLEAWRLDTQDCCNLIKTICDLGAEQGWVFSDEVTDRQYETIFTMYSCAD